MSNGRDGAVLVVGIEDDGTMVGLSEADTRKYSHDCVAPEVSSYASPYAEVAVTFGHIDLVSKNESRPNVRDEGFWTRERGHMEWRGGVTRQRRSSTS